MELSSRGKLLRADTAVTDDQQLPLHTGGLRAASKPVQQHAVWQHPAAPGSLAWQACCDLAGTIIAPLAAVAVVCAGVYVSSLEAGKGRPVDRSSCSCSCWDGKFKGRHGASTSGVQFKHVYFNIDAATAIMAIWCGVWVHLLMLCLQRIAVLAQTPATPGIHGVCGRRLAFGATLCGATQFYPLFYGVWTVLNYINDRFYVMLPSQLFFLLTELLPTYLCYRLMDANELTQLQQPLVPVLGVAVSVSHILLALKERVLWGLVLSGVHTINARDVALMTGDVACAVLFVRLLVSLRLGRPELARVLVWAAGCTTGLVGIYLLGFSYRLE